MTSKAIYERAKTHYRDKGIAEGYDSWRFETKIGRRRNRRKLAAISRAMDEAARRGHPIQSGLDMPCGTGRLFPLLARRLKSWIAADLSAEMMIVARGKQSESAPDAFIQLNGELLPFADESFDCVFSIRFMFHVPREVRVGILTEMRRVSSRWVILDLRHRYNLRYVGWLIRKRLGLIPEVRYRFSRADIVTELKEAGLELAGIYPAHRWFGFFSDKWVVLAEKRG